MIDAIMMMILTVDYVFSSHSVGLTQQKFQVLLDEPSVDVWKVDGARLDIWMSHKLFERLGWAGGAGSECRLFDEL